MSENKDFELLKHKVQFIESCEMTCEIGCHAADAFVEQHKNCKGDRSPKCAER